MNLTTWANFAAKHCVVRDGIAVIITGEVNGKPSLTIPDQALPIKEILARYVRGQDVVQFTPVYDEDLVPGIEGMTEIERTDLARQMKDDIQRSVSGSRRFFAGEIPPEHFQIATEEQLGEFVPTEEQDPPKGGN